jgi:hypothetical protein
MRQKNELSVPCPGLSLMVLIGGLGLAYLMIGFFIVWAYSVSEWSSTHGFHVEWLEIPSKTPWLLPGLILLGSVAFVRRQRWAAWVVTTVFILSALAVVFLFWRALLVVRVVPKKVGVFWGILSMWSSILGVGLSQLRQQIAWLRTGALPAGRGFPIELSRSE